MRGILVSIDAWDRRIGARVTVRAGASLNALTLGADGFTWEPVLTVRPQFSMQFADDDLTEQDEPGAGKDCREIHRRKVH